MHPDLQYEEFFDWMDEVRSPFTDLVYDRIVGKHAVHSRRLQQRVMCPLSVNEPRKWQSCQLTGDPT